MKKIIFGLLVAFVALSFMGCPTLHDDLELPSGDWFYIDVEVSGNEGGFLFVNSSGSPQTANAPADITSLLKAGDKVYISVDNLVMSVADSSLRPDESSLPALDAGKCRVFCFNSANLNVMWAWNGITPKGSEVPGFAWGDAPTAGMTKI